MATNVLVAIALLLDSYGYYYVTVSLLHKIVLVIANKTYVSLHIFIEYCLSHNYQCYCFFTAMSRREVYTMVYGISSYLVYLLATEIVL